MYPVFRCTPKPAEDLKPVQKELNSIIHIDIESEKWFDARAYAMQFFGIPEVNIEKLDVTNGSRPLPRHQIRWTGHAMRGSDGLKQLFRVLEKTDTPFEKGWQDVRQR